MVYNHNKYYKSFCYATKTIIYKIKLCILAEISAHVHLRSLVAPLVSLCRQLCGTLHLEAGVHGGREPHRRLLRGACGHPVHPRLPQKDFPLRRQHAGLRPQHSAGYWVNTFMCIYCSLHYTFSLFYLFTKPPFDGSFRSSRCGCQ